MLYRWFAGNRSSLNVFTSKARSPNCVREDTPKCNCSLAYIMTIIYHDHECFPLQRKKTICHSHSSGISSVNVKQAKPFLCYYAVTEWISLVNRKKPQSGSMQRGKVIAVSLLEARPARK